MDWGQRGEKGVLRSSLKWITESAVYLWAAGRYSLKVTSQMFQAQSDKKCLSGTFKSPHQHRRDKYPMPLENTYAISRYNDVKKPHIIFSPRLSCMLQCQCEAAVNEGFPPLVRHKHKIASPDNRIKVEVNQRILAAVLLRYTFI